jgi:multidrug efflux system membrane fusion protein
LARTRHPDRAGLPQTGPKIASVEKADFPATLPVSAPQGFNTVLVRTRVDGQINKIDFKEGQFIEGGTLVEIDPRHPGGVDQAKAKKQQDEANLANANLDPQRRRGSANLPPASSRHPAPTVAQPTAQTPPTKPPFQRRPSWITPR